MSFIADDDLVAVIGPLYALATGMTKVIASKPEVNRLTLLQAVAHAEGIRPSQVAEALGMHQSQTTREVQTLQEEGLLDVTGDPQDKRSRQLAVTAVGRVEIERLTAIGMSRWRSFVDGWDPADVKELGRLLAKLQYSIADANARTQGEPS